MPNLHLQNFFNTLGGTCQDVLRNCAEYTKNSCVDPYTNWAKQNCAKFCGFCGEIYTSLWDILNLYRNAQMCGCQFIILFIEYIT